jgi:hypothetical protein
MAALGQEPQEGLDRVHLSAAGGPREAPAVEVREVAVEHGWSDPGHVYYALPLQVPRERGDVASVVGACLGGEVARGQVDGDILVVQLPQVHGRSVPDFHSPNNPSFD